MALATYQSTKDSGTVWLGTIPKSWDLRRIGNTFTQRNVKVSDKDFQPLSVTKKGVVPQLETAAKTNDGDNRKKVVAGDFVINSRSDRKGSSGLSELDGSVSLISTVIRSSELEPRYTHHLLRSYPFQEEFYRWGQGIVADLWSTNYQRMKNIAIPVPSAAEQKKIADFLDEETAKIDNLIAKQEKLLKLLEEKRRATITHAVTRGLDPKVELKGTNIPWLGKIPAKWKIRKLNHLTALLIGSTPSTQNTDDFNGNEVWVTIADMQERIVTDSKQKLTKEAAAKKNMKKVPKGSVLFSFKLSVGKVAYCGIDVYTNEAIAAFVPKRDIVSEFLYYASQSYFINEAGENIYGAAIFNQELLKAVHIAVPPEDEQHIIAKYLDKENDLYNELRNKIVRQIKILKERRTGLISHAVTGKIKV